MVVMSRRGAFEDLRFAVTDVALHLVDTEFRFHLVFCEAGVAHVNAHHVLGDGFVAVPIVIVADDEDHVET